MAYLFLQTFIWLLLAFLFGLAMGWLLRGMLCGKSDQTETTAEASDTKLSSAPPPIITPAAKKPKSIEENTVKDTPKEKESTDISDDMRPATLAAPNGEADDLKRIKGIGPVIQKTLNELGIYHFQQIADFNAENIAWVDNSIAFPGRIAREGWVVQAQDLVKGVKTEFSQRYDKGEVGEKNPNRKT